MKAAAPAVALEPARREDAPLISHLLQLYIHDMSEIFPIEIGPDGRFEYAYLPHYWETPEERFPFLVRCDGAPAGFVLARRGSPATHDPADLDVAEFFVLRRHRRSGVGRAAAAQLWNRMPGHWIVRVSEANRPGLPFWRRIIADYTGGDFAEGTSAGSPHPWRVFSFHAPAAHSPDTI